MALGRCPPGVGILLKRLMQGRPWEGEESVSANDGKKDREASLQEAMGVGLFNFWRLLHFWRIHYIRR